MHNKRYWSCGLLLLLLASVAAAAEKPIYREGRFEKEALKYIHHVPVLVVAGTPQEMGRQEAALTGEAAKTIAAYPRQLIVLSGREKQWSQCIETARKLMAHASQAHRDELRSFADKAGVPFDLFLVGNTIMDLHRGGFACSSLMVEPAKSRTGGCFLDGTSTSSRWACWITTGW